MQNLIRCLATLALLQPAVDAQSTTFASLVYATVTTGGTPQDLLLDLVVPDGPGPWPLVVWVHGGGWLGGSRLPIPATATRLLTRGYAVASIDYRLSPTAIWPAQIQDCKAAIRFLRANAATFRLDPDRIGVMGSSAGGHLVAALATMGGIGEVHSGAFVVDLEGTVGAQPGTSSRVQCAIDQFGPTNMLLANDLPTFDHDAANSPESRLVGGPLQANAEKWATVDPISFVSPDDAPLLVMHGTDDMTVPFHQSQLLLDAARAIGNDVTLLPIPDNGHGGPGFLSPAATAAMDAFLDRTLRDLPGVVVGVLASDAIANENGDPAACTVSRSGSTAHDLVVSLWLDGEVLPADHEPFPLRCVIPAGQANTVLPLVPRDDDLVEGDERIELHVVPAAAYRIDHGTARAVATLFDDDAAAGLPVVTLVPLDPAATEAPGDPGAIRCLRTGSTANPLTVDYEIAGTATNGSDHVTLPSTVTIPAGSATALVVVAPLQDLQREPAETVVLRLAPAAHYARGAARAAHVVIADDDRSNPLPVVGVLGTDQSLAEPNGNGAFTVTRTGPTVQPLTVAFALTGTAGNGADFATVPGLALIPPGAAWVRVPIQVNDDPFVEGPESIDLTLAPAASYVPGAASTQQLCIDDDEAPPPAAGPVQLAVGPLAIGRTGTATLLGGQANGFASLWIALAPGYLPLGPLGIVQLDPAQAGPFALALLDGTGAASAPLSMPPTLALTGLRTWWQAIVSIPAMPFLVMTDVEARTVAGPLRF